MAIRQRAFSSVHRHAFRSLLAEERPKPIACIRRAPPVKQFGRSILRDADGRLVLVACDSEEDQRLLTNSTFKKKPSTRLHVGMSAET